ncbi:MAG TPA: ferrichrome ABC transporter permease, partial [Candidatus Angelobacter sp.]|nr:ferrichrome ABC transporter permease [Candidatus Angelobacter sp.]
MRPRLILYVSAIFLSSSLLFLVEPMAGKRLLPLLGGSSAVWITCLVFFQTTLLLGYLCAHAIATRLSRRAQLMAYGFLLALSLVQVFATLDPHPHASTVRPVFSVLWVLTMLIGLPFLALSATNPLLQSWYAHGGVSGDKVSAAPPYRLFALSNFGSLLALLAYPVLVEPNFSLRMQTLVWSLGFLFFVVVCGVIIVSGKYVPEIREPEPQPLPAVSGVTSTTSRTGTAAAPSLVSEPMPSPGERTLWLLMAACGSLLLSAVTSHLSQNIAAIPLLWILPLTIYLLTFVLAFNGGKIYSRRIMMGLLPS